VLRLNLSQLLTILEVVIHDPLYKWSLSPLQAQARRQQQTGGAPGGEAVAVSFIAPTRGAGGSPRGSPRGGNGGNGGGGQSHQQTAGGSSSSQDAAQRALLRIQNKLLGYVWIHLFVLFIIVLCCVSMYTHVSMLLFLTSSLTSCIYVCVYV
jgi:hypothetical protein